MFPWKYPLNITKIGWPDILLLAMAAITDDKFNEILEEELDKAFI